jgi:enterochelin esterase-like enzyme
MKKISCFFVMKILFLAIVFSQPAGYVVENKSMKSSIVPYDVNYCIYLPPGYEDGSRHYPVVYLLHGYSDKEWGWVQFGEIQEIADKAIMSREIPSMIIVMPDGKVTFYVNDYQGKDRYEDMFIQEFIPFIDAEYRTRPEKEFRGVAGLSMGGFGSLMFSMRHPDIFSACAAFSSAVWTDERISSPKSYDRFFSKLFGPRINGELPDYFRKYNPMDIARNSPEKELKKVRYYIDCGDDDFLIEGNCALHILLMERKIPHEFRVRDGRHSWEYWRTGIVAGLQFIGQSFHR